jgi:hypothetical protein
MMMPWLIVESLSNIGLEFAVEYWRKACGSILKLLIEKHVDREACGSILKLLIDKPVYCMCSDQRCMCFNT